jgi:hypothetical protein
MTHGRRATQNSRNTNDTNEGQIPFELGPRNQNDVAMLSLSSLLPVNVVPRALLHDHFVRQKSFDILAAHLVFYTYMQSLYIDMFYHSPLLS